MLLSGIVVGGVDKSTASRKVNKIKKHCMWRLLSHVYTWFVCLCVCVSVRACVCVCALRVFVCCWLSWPWQACGKGLDFHAFSSTLKPHQRHSLHNKSVSTVSHTHTCTHIQILLLIISQTITLRIQIVLCCSFLKERSGAKKQKNKTRKLSPITVQHVCVCLAVCM